MEDWEVPSCGPHPGDVYANSFKIGHNVFEFLLDFGLLSPEAPTPRLCARIITSPAHARILATLLREAIEEHETKLGAEARG